MNPTPRSALPRLAALALALVLAAGCGRNHAGTLLAPTGVRPAPATWPGSLSGYVFFDPLNTPDLTGGPFPPTQIQLFNGATLVATDSLQPFSRTYSFSNVPAGSYSIVVRSWAFLANSRGGLQVSDGPVDAGNLTLTVNPGAFSASIDLIGSMPNYDIGQLGAGTTTFLQNTLGIWTLTDTDYLLFPPPAIAAGTYRLKFVNSYASTAGNLVGWGWSETDTLTAPVLAHPAVLGSGRATDIVVRFPTTGTYTFMLDERRQRFTIQLAPTAAARSARRPS
jgi:hypothetical protein